MGASCCGRNTNVEEHDFHPKESFSSLIQKQARELEEEFPYLNYLDLYSFFDYLFRYNSSLQEQAFEGEQDGKRTSSFSNDMQETYFTEFVDKKIISNPILSSEYDEKKKDLFKDFVVKFFYHLNEAYKNYLIESKTKSEDEANSIEYLKKLHLLTIGFMLCNSSNRGKLDMVFNLFSKKKIIEKSTDFTEFVYLLIAINSTIHFKLLCDYGKNFTEEEKTQIESTYTYSNIFKLTNLFLQQLFHGDQEITYEELERAFVSPDSNLIWIFYGDGIRAELEKFKTNN
jgi:hypothetical protein